MMLDFQFITRLEFKSRLLKRAVITMLSYTFFCVFSTNPMNLTIFSRWRVYDSEDVKKPAAIGLMPRNLTIDGGFHFKDEVNVSDFEAMTCGMLELQIKLGRQLLNQSDLVNLIWQKVAVFNRLAHAYRVIYQRKIKSPQRDDPDSANARPRGSVTSIDALVIGDRDRVGTQALVELGLTTGT